MSILIPVASAQPIKVGLTAMYPPFEFRDKGHLVGFDLDLINAIAKDLGWELTFKDMPFDELLPSLDSEQIDLVISAFNVTPERKKQLALSQVYYSQNKLVWLTKKDSVFAESKNLHGLKVGVQTSTILEDWAKDQAKKQHFQLRSVYSTPLLIEKLKSNELDVAVVEEIQGNQYCKVEPNLVFYHTNHSIGGYVIAFRKGSPLLAKVNTKLDKLKSEGYIEQLESKWLKPANEQ